MVCECGHLGAPSAGAENNLVGGVGRPPYNRSRVCVVRAAPCSRIPGVGLVTESTTSAAQSVSQSVSYAAPYQWGMRPPESRTPARIQYTRGQRAHKVESQNRVCTYTAVRLYMYSIENIKSLHHRSVSSVHAAPSFTEGHNTKQN